MSAVRDARTTRRCDRDLECAIFFMRGARVVRWFELIFLTIAVIVWVAESVGDVELSPRAHGRDRERRRPSIYLHSSISDLCAQCGCTCAVRVFVEEFV